MIKTPSVYKPLYLDKEKFIILVTGGRGSGKTHGITTFIERLTFEKNHKILFSRYTMTSAGDSIIPEFKKRIEEEGVEQYFKVNRSDIVNTMTGSQVMFRGIKTSSGVQTAKLKGIEGVTVFVGDEMEEWEDEESFEKLILSIRKKGMQLRVILIMNPSNAQHFVYKKYIKDTHKIVEIDGVDVQISTHPDVLHIHTSYLDTIGHLNEQFVKEVERKKEQAIEIATQKGEFEKSEFNETSYAHIIMGRWNVVAKGVIFKKWKLGEFDTSLPYCYGMDFGFSKDPDTLTKVALDNKRKIIYVKQEYYRCQQNSTLDLVRICKSRLQKADDLIIADSAELRLINDIKNEKINIKPCKKTPGCVSASLILMQDYTIVVSSHSEKVIHELNNYKWHDKKAGIPKDEENHSIDGIRYAFDYLNTRPNNNLTQLLSTI